MPAHADGQGRDWVIREAGAGDIEALALIGAATFLETFAPLHTSTEIVAHCRDHHCVAAYEKLLGSGGDGWMVEMVTTGAPVGYAVLTPVDLPGATAGDLELKRIYTLSKFHGGGLGATLLQRVIDRAQARGAARLLLDVYSQNARAIAFYRKHGFEPIGAQPFLVGDTAYDDLVMAKPLSAAA